MINMSNIKNKIGILLALVIFAVTIPMQLFANVTGDSTVIDNNKYGVQFEVTDDWGQAFNGEVSITNNSDQVIEDWEIQFDFDRNIDRFWTANIVENTDAHYTVSSLEYNSYIAPGDTIKLGFAGNPGDVKSKLENIQLVAKIRNITSFDEVGTYVSKNGKLPDNYITKSEAYDLGWEPKEGNLQEVAPGKSIGGNRFGNWEGLLPIKEGRIWYEADINYHGGYRGSERLLFSNDGLIYTTTDHYKTFKEWKLS